MWNWWMWGLWKWMQVRLAEKVLREKSFLENISILRQWRFLAWSKNKCYSIWVIFFFMYTFSFSHFHSINIFRDILSESWPLTLSESHEQLDHPSHEDIFRGEFLRLLESEDFRAKLQAAIKDTPNTTQRGGLMNAYLGLEATRKKIAAIHEKTQWDLHALMTRIQSNIESVTI